MLSSVGWTVVHLLASSGYRHLSHSLLQEGSMISVARVMFVFLLVAYSRFKAFDPLYSKSLAVVLWGVLWIML